MLAIMRFLASVCVFAMLTAFLASAIEVGNIGQIVIICAGFPVLLGLYRSGLKQGDDIPAIIFVWLAAWTIGGIAIGNLVFGWDSGGWIALTAVLAIVGLVVGAIFFITIFTIICERADKKIAEDDDLSGCIPTSGTAPNS